MSLNNIPDSNNFILTEGSVIELIRRSGKYRLNENLLNSSMLFDDAGRKILDSVYRAYIDIAIASGKSIIIQTPSWRANPERCNSEGLDYREVNHAAYCFLKMIRDDYRDHEHQIFIAGLMGPKADAYNPIDALAESDSELFHRAQYETLFNSGIDLAIAATLPALGEAIGLAKVMSASHKCDSCARPECTGDSLSGTNCVDYIISFLIGSDGKLPDGTYLGKAIEETDDKVSVRPLGYMVNCVHPSNLIKALNIEQNRTELVRKRLIGIQGNSSLLSPDELNGRSTLDRSDQTEWINANKVLFKEYGLWIFGGCCGTDPDYINQLAHTLKEAQ